MTTALDNTKMRRKTPILAAIALTLVGSGTLISTPVAVAETEQRPLSLTDIMQFREIEQRVTSDNGSWMAFAAVPDFGDSQGQVVNTLTAERFYVERGDQPQLSGDGRYAAFRQQMPLLQREQAEHVDADEDLKKAAKRTHLVVVDTSTGEQVKVEDIQRFAFTGDNQTLVMLESADKDNKDAGQTLRVRNLSSGDEQTITNVAAFSVAEAGPRVALVRTLVNESEESEEDEATDKVQQLRVLNTSNGSALTLKEDANVRFHSLSFNHQGDSLAFLQGPSKSENPDPEQQLWVWQYGQNQTGLISTQRAGFVLSEHATPSWSEDDARLFIGYRVARETPAADPAMPQSDADLYDLDYLLSDRRLQVWHGDDERILTHQRATYQATNKATMPAVVWMDEQRLVPLSSDIEDSWRQTEHSNAQLITNGGTHLREITWNGFYHDIDHVNLHTGERQTVVERVRSSERGALSPDGRYVAYVNDEQYYVFDAQSGDSAAVAADIQVSWVDEQNDRPMEASSYGVAGWLDDNSAFLAYDRYDIWKITLDGEATRLTENGRESEKQFRIRALNDALGFASDARLLVHSYSDSEKYHGFWSLDLGSGDFNRLIEDQKRYRFVEYLEAQERVLFTEEDFRQFPDIQSAPLDFSERIQLTEINPQISEFKWGHAELIDWQTEDGETLQGVVIKPDDYDASRTYPVMVYYYEKYSQRLYHFNQMKVNHRPNFPFYVGQDYVVFLPDIRFRPGAPGPSATESLVPGVQKLIDEGIADANAIGLHGHSWSGYQSAFVVTETDMFAAVVSGAPVSNMTSAYTGIRWQSGLARQFQYETGQSRIGPSMYENLDLYIKNSPVFFADQINTPMLIQFGDADGAVPWEQGIEYYLALRRLDKDVVMLHYEDEPHHLQRYANKIDYTVKMLEFFDHYLKGEPAPDWWAEGMPYISYE